MPIKALKTLRNRPVKLGNPSFQPKPSAAVLDDGSVVTTLTSKISSDQIIKKDSITSNTENSIVGFVKKDNNTLTQSEVKVIKDLQSVPEVVLGLGETELKEEKKTNSKFIKKQQQSDPQRRPTFPKPDDKATKSESDINVGEDKGVNFNQENIPDSPEYKSGISFYRPEIIALTKFNPLYDDNRNLTEHGSLFNSLVESLRKADVDARRILNSSSEEQKKVLEKNEKLKEEISILYSKMQEISTFVKFFSSLQNSLNIQSHKFNPQAILSNYFQNPQTFSTYDSINPYVSKLPSSLDLNKSLYSCLEYKDKNEDKNNNFFSSSPTRSWVISIEEMKQLIHSHSRLKMKEKISSQNPDTSGGMSQVGYPDLKSLDRITAKAIVDIGSGVQDFILQNMSTTFELTTNGVTTGAATQQQGGQTRFLTLEKHKSKFINTNNDDVNAISTILYVVLKEIRQRACLSSRGENTSFDSRDQKVNSITLNQYQKNYPVYKRFSNDSYSGIKLYDIGIFGELRQRDVPIFALESSKIPGSKTGKDYFFNDFGSESFFSQTLTKEGNTDRERVQDFVTSLKAVETLFADFILNSGIFPIDDSKIQNLEFSTDPITFLEDICAKFIDDEGRFLTTKKYLQLAGGYQGAGNRDLDVLMLFGLASGNSVIKQNMGSKDVVLKERAVQNKTYQVIYDVRNPEQNVAIMKNALYSYIINKINGVELGDVNRPVLEIYNVLTNIADVVGAGLTTENTYDDFANSNEGRTKIVLDSSGPVDKVPDDEFVKWGMFSIQTEPVDENPTTSKPPLAFKEIQTTLENSPLVETIVDIMRPIVNSSISQEFSLVIFDLICNLIGTFAPFKNINVYINDYNQSDSSKSSIVFFTKFYRINEKYTKQQARLYKQQIIKNLVEETTSLISLSFSCISIVSKLLSLFVDAQNKLFTFKRDIVEYLAKYLGPDPRKISLLFNEQQLSLILTFIQDVYDSLNTTNSENQNESKTDELFNKHLLSMSYANKTVDVLRNFFNNSKYSSSQGYNKQILTVGIPQGLLKELFYKSKESSDYTNLYKKSDDIFKILIYKIDLLNDEVVYLPQEFLFETSRFPVRTYSKISNVNQITNSASDFENYLFKVFPTRDYEIFGEKSGKNLFMETKPVSSINEVFQGDYSKYLTTQEMSSILDNHITSFILENYLNVISGMEFNESTFMLTDLTEIENLYKNLYSYEISGLKVPLNIRDIGSNVDPFLTKLIHPKKFDRVFNIIFDPDSFVVDETKTNKSTIEKLSKYPKNALKQVTFQNQVYYTDSDKTFKDPSLNAYFVNIETLNSPESAFPSNIAKSNINSPAQEIKKASLTGNYYVWKN